MKRLIVCCDGTWNAADAKSAQTNVFKIATAIHANQGTIKAGNAGTTQIVLYLRGVGTTGLAIGDLIEGAIGLGIDEPIRSAYMFLAQNYVPGDEIFLFGFSRGAFTARSLVGLMSAAGLLKRQSLPAIEAAWDYYRSPKPHSPAMFMTQSKADCHLGVTIKFLGVWDTVGALGIPGQLLADDNAKRYGFHDTEACASVLHACQALAIDEHRDQFVPTFWTGSEPIGCTIEQVWFAGAHSDVGGGYKTRTLADIPLVWVAKKAEADGLDLDWSCLPDPSTLDSLAPTHDSRTGFFSIDKIRTTWREVCQTPCDVAFYEYLYAPVDTSGNRLPTINERLHESVANRFDKLALACSDDDKGASANVTYEPRTIVSLSDAQRVLPPGLIAP